MRDAHAGRKNAMEVRCWCVIVGIGAVLSMTGCASNSVPAGSTLPPPDPATNSATYVGSAVPGYWNLTVDDTGKNFSNAGQSLNPASTGYTSTAGSGQFKQTDGILDLGSYGKAVERASRVAVLRPGDSTAIAIPMIAESSCFAINGKQRYVFLQTASSHTSNYIHMFSYGTFVVSTNTAGSTWNFEDLHTYGLNTASMLVENTEYPNIFSAACAAVNGAGMVTPNASAFPVDSTATNATARIAPTFRFQPAGAMLADQSPVYQQSLSLADAQGWIGVAAPSSAVKSSDVATGTYRGFAYVPLATDGVLTRPVAFSLANDGSNNLIGGVYPNDDLTQPPGTEYTFTLGKQDSALNGIFPKGTLTELDPNSYCGAGNNPAQGGRDGNGNPYCLATLTALAAQVDGKYVLYVTTVENKYPPPAAGITRPVPEIQFFLYQQ